MTETFDLRWLALREPVDHAARRRSAVALAALRAALRAPDCREADAGAPADARAPLAVLDLGAGSGSNLRFLAPRLGGRQHWVPCDHDARLLTAAIRSTARWAASQAPHRVAVDAAPASRALPATGDFGAGRFTVHRDDGPNPWSAEVSPLQVDLRTLDRLPADRARLVTASALLDLVGDAWLRALVARCTAARAAVLWALDVDGRVRIVPADRADRIVRRDLERDTRRDKGFGPALGARAGARAAALLSAAGYRVVRSRSDWRIGASHAALAEALLAGWASAASAARPSRSRVHAGWLRRRRSTLARRRLHVLLGHTDVAAWPLLLPES
jgi:hypothetical protein